MIRIGNKIISQDILNEYFLCDLEKCRGNCCVYGDSGAPLEDDEIRLIEKHLPEIKLHMRAEGIHAINDQGAWVIDHDGEKVTPLVDNEECAYTVFEEGIARCSIEIAFQKGSIPFQKPVSCHLYPVRVNRLKNGVALNYDQWNICEPARLLGKKNRIPVFRFLEDALIRVFGRSFYDELESIYQELSKETPKSI
jgi:hypothetical protein